MLPVVLFVFFWGLPLALPAQIAPLDYTSAANWAAHPMKLFDLPIKPSYTLIAPDTMQKTVVNVPYPPVNASVDVFAVSPTTLINAGSPAATIPLNVTQKSALNFAVQLNFGHFGRFGRIHAPYYRQSNLATFTLPVAQAALQAAIFDTAATDVLAAFEHYMEFDNKGKKVLLLGHSQGTLLLEMMLRRMESNPSKYSSYLEKIVAAVAAGAEGGAYVAQNQVTGGWLENVPFCQYPADTTCVMTWMTVKSGLVFLSSTPLGNFIPVNSDMISRNLKYEAFNPGQQRQWGDPLGYTNTPQKVGLSMFPKIYIASGASGVTTDWVAYEQFYTAQVVQPNASAWAISVEHPVSGDDKRHDPVGNSMFADLHLYDMYILAGAVFEGIENKIKNGVSATKPEFGETNLLVYPNPVHDALVLPKGVEHVRVFDLRGRMFLEQEAADAGSLPLARLPAGVYILEMAVANRIKRVRLVKI